VPVNNWKMHEATPDVLSSSKPTADGNDYPARKARNVGKSVTVPYNRHPDSSRRKEGVAAGRWSCSASLSHPLPSRRVPKLSLDGGAAAQTGNKLNNYAGKVIGYEVTGNSGMVESVTYMTNNGQQQETKVTLPWFSEFTADQGLHTLMVRAHSDGPGSIKCRILVDGKRQGQATSGGRHATATCSVS
jgi:Mycobacterium membrane protein